MENLITITEQDGKQIVSAGELHRFLEVESNFTTWAKRMFEYGFEDEKDFPPILEETNIGRPSTDYTLTDTAKEISMIQRSEKGKVARLYFLACEKKLKEFIPPTHLEVLDSESVSILQASGKTNVCELFTL